MLKLLTFAAKLNLYSDETVIMSVTLLVGFLIVTMVILID